MVLIIKFQCLFYSLTVKVKLYMCVWIYLPILWETKTFSNFNCNIKANRLSINGIIVVTNTLCSLEVLREKYWGWRNGWVVKSTALSDYLPFPGTHIRKLVIDYNSCSKETKILLLVPEIPTIMCICSYRPAQDTQQLNNEINLERKNVAVILELNSTYSLEYILINFIHLVEHYQSSTYVLTELLCRIQCFNFTGNGHTTTCS